MKFQKIWAAGIIGLLPISASGQTAAQDPVAARINEAQTAAGALYGPVQQHLCFIHSPEDDARLAARRKISVLMPTKVFDNFYYVGAEEVASWALTTGKGIILFDTLDNPAEAKTDIVEGLRKLGLDPTAIKYIVVTHGHGDHFGGANFLKSLAGAKIVMSQADAALVESQKNGSGGSRGGKDLIPEPDLIVADGQSLTLGDATVTFHITPGHTPGTLSSIFKVRDRGKAHTLAFWGGVGVPDKEAPLAQYVQSADSFARLAASEGADIAITNHPHADMTLEWVAQLHDSHPVSNPLIVGSAGVARWFGVIKACAQAQQARLTAGLPPEGRRRRTSPSP